MQDWRDLLWWRTIQAMRTSGVHDIRHPAHGWNRTLERSLENCFGVGFPARAQDRAQWERDRPLFLAWTVQAFGGPLPRPPPRVKRLRRV